MVLIWMYQSYIYPWGKNKLSNYCVIICVLFWILIGLQIIFTYVIIFIFYSLLKYYQILNILILLVVWVMQI